MKVFYSTAYTCSEATFDTTQKAKWVADSLVGDPIAGVELIEPHILGWSQISRLHDTHYVNAVRFSHPRELAESSGLSWMPGLPTAVRASTSGAVAAALAALDGRCVTGSLSSGLHHAKYGSGHGFCVFNGLALAAHVARDRGAERVLVVDFDAHCGGGTYSLMSDCSWFTQVDVSTSWFDEYDSANGTSLAIVQSHRQYLWAINSALDAVDLDGVDLVLYNAGMDPHEDCDIGGLRGITREALAEREATVFAWARKHRLPLSFVLAGGYVGERLSRERLIDLHRLTIAAAAR